MKKIITSVFVGILFLSYIIYQRSLTSSSTNTDALALVNDTNSSQSVDTNSNANTIVAGDAPRGETTNPATTPVTTPTTKPVTTPTTPAASTGKFKNGVYTGVAADAYYGNVQVKATISGGKLTAIEFLQYPNDRSHSVEINQYALPILRSEAISNQSANVSTVSGASDSSAAFRESLQSALSQA